jgi:hypothetical protein
MSKLKEKSKLLELAQQSYIEKNFDTCADYLIKTISGEDRDAAAIDAAGIILATLTRYILVSKFPDKSEAQISTLEKQHQQDLIAKQFDRLKESGINLLAVVQAGLDTKKAKELYLSILTKAATQIEKNQHIFNQFLAQEIQENNHAIANINLSGVDGQDNEQP